MNKEIVLLGCIGMLHLMYVIIKLISVHSMEHTWMEMLFAIMPSCISIKSLIFWVNIIKCSTILNRRRVISWPLKHPRWMILIQKKRTFIQSYAIRFFFIFYLIFFFFSRASLRCVSMSYCNYKYIHFIIYCTNYSKWNKWTVS